MNLFMQFNFSNFDFTIRVVNDFNHPQHLHFLTISNQDPHPNFIHQLLVIHLQYSSL